MATWLDAAAVVTAIGDDLADQVNAESLQGWCDAARDFVEDRRPDLFDDAVPPVYQPTPRVKSGTAFLAYRLYQRRKSPLGILGVTNDQASGMASGILREDPDIERLLGIGRRRRFAFGAPRDEEAV